MGSRRAFKGQVHVRISPEMHEKIAKEAFAKSQDPDDDRFLSLAVEGRADFLITGDKTDLLSLAEIDGIPIVSAKLAMEALNGL